MNEPAMNVIGVRRYGARVSGHLQNAGVRPVSALYRRLAVGIGRAVVAGKIGTSEVFGFAESS